MLFYSGCLLKSRTSEVIKFIQGVIIPRNYGIITLHPNVASRLPQNRSFIIFIQ